MLCVMTMLLLFFYRLGRWKWILRVNMRGPYLLLCRRTILSSWQGEQGKVCMYGMCRSTKQILFAVDIFASSKKKKRRLTQRVLIILPCSQKELNPKFSQDAEYHVSSQDIFSLNGIEKPLSTLYTLLLCSTTILSFWTQSSSAITYYTNAL